MLNLVWFRGWRTACLIADGLVTSPVISWTWSGLSQTEYNAALREYRPTDRETVREMMHGRYLLASKLVDTEGVSPFSIQTSHRAWHDELHSFSWLRHFRDARDEGERQFARTLVLDWIGRNSEYDKDTWGLALTGLRVMNWLRHFNLLEEGASRDQIKTISQSISMQVQSARLRGPFALDPLDELMAAVLPVGVSLSDKSTQAHIAQTTEHLCNVLENHLDGDGFHRSRNAALHLLVLTELVSLRLTLSQISGELVRRLGGLVDNMHLALDSVTLGTGQPAYFNGCGQIPVELMFAVQTQGAARRSGNALVAGYGVIVEGESVVVLDGGKVPEAAFAGNAHASALAFEFSHGRELIVGNCGPAPDELSESRDLFRQGAAHSGPTIDDHSSARFGGHGVLFSYGDKPKIEVGRSEPEIVARTGAFRSRFGIEIERRVSLVSSGATLVGQDRMIAPGGLRKFSGNLMQRFHLAAGAVAQRVGEEEIIHIRLKSGAVWTFLWEGSQARIEQSVRQSAHIGFYRTQQIVLEAPVVPDAEIAWIFTRQ
ncbi:MAG TPA: hypothetical protein ENJ90_11770 [Devosia sp.]|nr:hypothetical protein [Devosia sp.]